MTATAVMQLVERGALGLEDSVEGYLPEFSSGGVSAGVRSSCT